MLPLASLGFSSLPRLLMSTNHPIPQPRPPKPVVIPFLLTLALFSFIAVFTLSPPTRLLRRLNRLLIRPIYVLLGRVPLPKALEPPSSLSIAISSFSSYANDQQQSINRKHLSYERMRKRHRQIGQQLSWKRVLGRTEDAIDSNSHVTDELAAIGLDIARKEGIPYGIRSRFKKEKGRVVEVRSLSQFIRVLCSVPGFLSELIR